MRALKSSTRRKVDECGIGRCLTLSGFGSMPMPSLPGVQTHPNEAMVHGLTSVAIFGSVALLAQGP